MVSYQREPVYLYTLPLELFLLVVDNLDPETFINFAFASYPLLRQRGLVPAMSIRRLAHLLNQTSVPGMFRLLPLPTETILQIMKELKPKDLMRFVLANYQDLVARGLAPVLNEGTVNRLRLACSQE